MNMKEICDHLIANGWIEYPNQFKPSSRCFYKRHDTPTRCNCNNDKQGMQIEISVSQLDKWSSYEVELRAELPDETWISLHSHGMPNSIEEGLKTIPRLLATWEFIANHK